MDVPLRLGSENRFLFQTLMVKSNWTNDLLIEPHIIIIIRIWNSKWPSHLSTGCWGQNMLNKVHFSISFSNVQKKRKKSTKQNHEEKSELLNFLTGNQLELRKESLKACKYETMHKSLKQWIYKYSRQFQSSIIYLKNYRPDKRKTLHVPVTSVKRK